MKICFMCDLHLPFEEKALQYNVLEWAMEDIKKKQPGCVIYAGDVTCDGNINVYNLFINKMNSMKIPFIYIPGNSDLRCTETKDEIMKKASPCKNIVDGIEIIALNDCNATLEEPYYCALDEVTENTIVFMHHPIIELKSPHDQKMQHWREKHSGTMLFFAHMHKSYEENNTVSLQALDPDKAIGECPCLTYYDTETRKLNKAHYFCPVPNDIYDKFGISCYRIGSDIEFAINGHIKNLELRPDIVKYDFEQVKIMIDKWRQGGGENLSIHLPDIRYIEGKVYPDESLDRLIELARILKVDRFTQHVPVVSVAVIKEDKDALSKIAKFIADKINTVKHQIIVGVENMHMTSKDLANDSRRFGYLPEECLAFMHILSEHCIHKVGINFDIGHARNNMPYSQKYQISTWLAMVGEFIVGYHLHQVTLENGVFNNHMPITEVYGCLISYASFFRCWMDGKIKKAPMIFEMRPENAYEVTMDTFLPYKNRKVTDLHSHTYYSLCGRDNPHDLIKTAINNGISVLGISDHNYGIGERKRQYLEEIRSLAEIYKDKIKILCGIEIATLPHLYDIKDISEIREYDYCLIENITDSNSLAAEDIISFCSGMGIPCGIAHTDMFAYCDMYGLEYNDFLRKMAQAGIFWEMNVSYDSIHRYKEHAYVHEFMTNKDKQQIIKNAGLYLSVGFDSHRCEDYDGVRVHEMNDFLVENQFNIVDDKYLKR